MYHKQIEKAPSKGAEKRETGPEKYTKTKCLTVFSPVSYLWVPLGPAAPFIHSTIALFQPVNIFDKVLKPGRFSDDNVN